MSAIPKKIYHDRLMLLLYSVSLFVSILTIVLIILRLDSSRGSYIVQYRDNLGLGAYKAGGSATFIEFIFFVILIFGLQALLSVRTYRVHRYYSVTIASLGLLLLVLAGIVSNALLVLR